MSRLTLAASRASFPSWPGFIQGQFLQSQPTRPRAAKVRALFSAAACWLQPCLSPQQRVRGQPCVMMSLVKGTCWKNTREKVETGLRVMELGTAAVGRQVPRAGVRCRRGLSCCPGGPSHKWEQAPGAQRPSQSAWTATPTLASMLPPGLLGQVPLAVDRKEELTPRFSQLNGGRNHLEPLCTSLNCMSPQPWSVRRPGGA